MSAFDDFLKAMFEEREKDPRQIVSASLTAEMLNEISDEAKKYTLMENNPDYKNAQVQTLYGIPLHTWDGEGIRFDH